MNRLPVLTFSLLLAASTNATELRLLPASSGDLAPAALTRVSAKAILPDLERAPVALSWALDPAEALSGQPRPERQVSKEYWTEASATELSRGFEIFTTAAGALVRINPVDPSDKAGAIEIAGLAVRTAGGQEFRGAEAFALAVGDAELKAAGVGFADGTVAFRLGEAVGAGTLTLTAPAKVGSGYVVHVLDQHSTVTFGATTTSWDLVGGDTLRARASVEAAGTRVAATVAGFVTSPDGAVHELSFGTSRDGLAVARLQLDQCVSTRPGLWEVHASARAEVDGKVALRSVRTAFSCAEATARFTGTATIGGPTLDAGALIANFGVDAAVAGRYEVRGILFGTTPTGVLVPAASAHSAAWLEPGFGTIRLVIDSATLATTGLVAPFEIRDLTLLDQGRMGVIHRQARGLVVPN